MSSMLAAPSCRRLCMKCSFAIPTMRRRSSMDSMLVPPQYGLVHGSLEFALQPQHDFRQAVTRDVPDGHGSTQARYGIIVLLIGQERHHRQGLHGDGIIPWPPASLFPHTCFTTREKSQTIRHVSLHDLFELVLITLHDKVVLHAKEMCSMGNPIISKRSEEKDHSLSGTDVICYLSTNQAVMHSILNDDGEMIFDQQRLEQNAHIGWQMDLCDLDNWKLRSLWVPGNGGQILLSRNKHRVSNQAQRLWA